MVLRVSHEQNNLTAIYEPRTEAHGLVVSKRTASEVQASLPSAKKALLCNRYFLLVIVGVMMIPYPILLVVE